MALLALAGCETPQSIVRAAVTPQLRSDGFEGARATAGLGAHGVQLGVGAFWDELARPFDPSRHAAGGIEVNGRVSLFGLFADDHRLERYFDVGFDGGAGGGFAHPANLDSLGELWGGGWLDIGLGGESYPAIALGVHEVAYSESWNSETVYTLGLAWVLRSTQPLLTK